MNDSNYASRGYDSKGGGRGSRGGRKGGGKGKAPDGQAWDVAQQRSLSDGVHSCQPVDLARMRPQQRVEVFPHLTVAADWPENRPPRSGSAFYLPLIWTSLLPDPPTEGRQISKAEESAMRQLASLGDAQHFHDGKAKRSSLEDVWAAQVYWRNIFSGWDDWVRRLRSAMERFSPPGYAPGRETLVNLHVQTLSVKACALIYGDLRVLGSLPHISNARRAPDQDTILELDFDLRMEIEASVQTLFVRCGEIIPVANATTSTGSSQDTGNVEPSAVEVSNTTSDLEKEIMKIRKKLREIEKLKERPIQELDVLQARKLEGETELLHRLQELEAG